MKLILVKIFLIAFLVGCSSAKKSSEVSAAYVPMSRFSSMDCKQLINEAEALRRSTPALESAVDSHRSQQNNIELVTWILFWPAAFALDKGDRQANDLSIARGELQAIQQALLSRNCNSISKEPTIHRATSDSSIENKLSLLKNLKDKNLITSEQYTEQVNELLKIK